MTIHILRGDVLAMLATLPDESVHCCVTSPPYYGLRDYGVAGQLGLEPTLAEYIEKMVAVFREVRRVLRGDGTLWLNIGDSYANDGKWGGSTGGKHVSALHDTTIGRGKKDTGLKPKDLMMVPERLALALQADGWWVRSRIIWHKRSTMPESVTDRPTKAHEHIWLLTKSELYYYDSEAASEPALQPAGEPSQVAQHKQAALGHNSGGTLGTNCGSGRRNWRDVWSLGPEPFKDAHFATFPTEIPRRAIVAGCPASGTVLDPFLGSGTTALVADRLQRNAIGIELNPAYADMAEKRIRGDAPLFAEVA